MNTTSSAAPPSQARKTDGGSGTGSGGAAGRYGPGRALDRHRPTLVAYGVLIALVTLYAALDPGVLTIDELNLQAGAALALILVATGQTLVLLIGGIDLSVGGVVSISTCLAATHFAGTVSQIVWSVIIVAVGAGAGLVNGALITVARVNAFVVTLATWSVFGGIALLILPTTGGSIPPSFTTALTGYVGRVATPVLLILALAGWWLWYRSSRSGSRLKALGSSGESAYLSGVPVVRAGLLAYTLSGTFAALGGLFLVTQTSGGDPLIGNDFVLTSVAAAVIGGCALTGGRGDVLGTIAGALIITLLGSVVFTLSLPTYWQPVATGGLLVIAAGISAFLERRGKQVTQ